MGGNVRKLVGEVLRMLGVNTLRAVAAVAGTLCLLAALVLLGAWVSGFCDKFQAAVPRRALVT